jgi:polar amino acid transport system ATP-binding protein
MIYISELSKTFSGQKVLDGIDIDIEKGEVVALVGASGAGKSTILRSLNYLEQPDSGTITIDDFKVDFETITKEQILTLRRKLAMVFQQFNLFERRTALDNVKEGLKIVKKLSDEEATKIAKEELAKVGLSNRENHYPRHLSGGQKQRVALARALAMKPDVLLLDEPTSALDPELVGEVEKSIADAAKSGQTMILVSHDMNFVYQVADKVLFLEKGRILEQGTPDEVFNHPKEERTRKFLSRYLTLDSELPLDSAAL